MLTYLTHERVHYATNDGYKLHLNLYLPPGSGGPWPVVVWIVGGGWRDCGNGSQAAFLTRHGFAVASIYYRVSSEAIAPANIRDCKAAVRWLRANAGEFNLDADHIGVFGSSAGGHLSALYALSEGVAAFEEGDNQGYSSAIQAACDFCGPSDLMMIAEAGYRAADPILYEVTADYLGGPVAEREDLARLVSPMSYIKADGPPLLIVHGSQDGVVFPKESQILYDALHAAGADVTLRILDGAGHGWDWALTNEQVTQFFQRTLGKA